MILQTTDHLALIYGDKTVFRHTEKAPFVTAVQMNLHYHSSHGIFSVKEKMIRRIPLSKYSINKAAKNLLEIIFSGGKIELTMTAQEGAAGLELKFFSESDCAFEFAFAADGEEAIFGGGEQFRQLNLKGEKVINFVSEHIKIWPIAQKTVLKFWPYREKKHCEISTYAPMSTFVSSKRYALRIDTDGYGIQDFTRADKTILRYQYCPSKILFTTGSSFKEIGQKLALDQKINHYLPDWAYDGMILGVQGGINRAIEKAEKMLNLGASICGVWCQDWSGRKITSAGKQVYWNWTVDEVNYGSLKEKIAYLKSRGVHFLAYINPYLVKDGPMYNHCKDKGYLIKDRKGAIYHIKSSTFDAGMMDLTNPEMVHYLKETIIKRNMLDLGIDGYMADFGEYLPVDSVLYKGDAKILHNQWPVLWAKINREAISEHERAEEIFFFTRSGYNGVQQYTTIMWNGDQHTDYSKDYGMPCVLPASFNLGFSGLTAVHSDIGGFISFASLARDEELFVRWAEMNTFSPLMRSHESIRPENNAQFDGAVAAQHMVRLSNIHKMLKPYIKRCMAEANEGIPVIRPDFYNASDYSAHRDLYSYLFGDDIFVAPVIEKGATSRRVYLPEGDWIGLFTGKKYKPGQHVVEAPLGKPAVFYRATSRDKDLFESITAEYGS